MIEKSINNKVKELKCEIAKEEKKYKAGIFAMVKMAKAKNNVHDLVLCGLWLLVSFGLPAGWLYLLLSGMMFEGLSEFLRVSFRNITELGVMVFVVVGVMFSLVLLLALWMFLSGLIVNRMEKHYRVRITGPFPLVGDAVDNEQDALLIAGNSVPVDHYEVTVPGHEGSDDKALFENVVFFCDENGKVHSINMLRYGMDISKSSDEKMHYVTKGGTRLVSLMLPAGYWDMPLREKFALCRKEYRE